MKLSLMGMAVILLSASALVPMAQASGSPYTLCKYEFETGAPDHIRPPNSDSFTKYYSGHVSCPSTYVGAWGYYLLKIQRHFN
ncbi:hypothetical protein L1077_20700 [Pseudoalteromonas luteoviolacea]|uniref:hypothetical protein n=1 Tax=Pseudoalteromonas luteoviolacea TaxID=43657 RepID=UPI001F38B426|nr:hypothetical protein [Pseudoalteromonas luteoviolacea]MCF6441860.1 hypothetical protein [Pseudoalteromonas luteoviolacea]